MDVTLANVMLCALSSSEFGLIHARVTVEVRWLQALANRPEITEVPAFSAETNAALDAIVANFSEEQCQPH